MTTEIDLGIDHLTDVQMIGRGGFSVVYSASHTLFKRRMAVKLLNALTKESDRLRFERECEVLGRLSDHPNVVSVYNAGYSDNDRPYLLMELVEGGTLQNRLEQDGPLPWQDVVAYLIPICDALGAAHAESILHRDVKPENILLTDDGKPRLADFGIASLRDATGATSTHITASMLHTAPETFENQRDERSDLYSLASSLFALVVGRAPFWHDTDQSIHPLMNRLLNDPAPAMPAGVAPPELSALVQRTLAKDPNRRPQTAEAFSHELKEILDGSSERPGHVHPPASATQVAPEPPPTAGRFVTDPTSLPAPPPAFQGFTPPTPAIQGFAPTTGPGPTDTPYQRPNTGPSPTYTTGGQSGRLPPRHSEDVHPVRPEPVGPQMAAGWYHATGDPAGTQRFWTGAEWQGSPQPVAASPAGQLASLGLELASPERRILARSVDILIWLSIWIVLLVALIPTDEDGGSEYIHILALGIFTTIAIAAYEIGMVTAFGATIGKLLTSSRIVNEDGSAVGFATAAMRMVLFIVLSVFSSALFFPFLIMLVIGGVAMGSIFNDERRQTMWDRHAKTLVVTN
jgi:serine/threonine protein kinase/uncharacterized RDD family membrane protein YckC